MLYRADALHRNKLAQARYPQTTDHLTVITNAYVAVQVPLAISTPYIQRHHFIASTLSAIQRTCHLEISSLENGQHIRHCRTMYHACWRMTVYTTISTETPTIDVAPKSTTLTSWADSYAATINAKLADGRARRLLSLYECILDYAMMRRSIINVVGNVTVSVNPF